MAERRKRKARGQDRNQRVGEKGEKTQQKSGGSNRNGQPISILKQANVYHIKQYLGRDEADAMMKFLDRADKFSSYQLYFFDSKTQGVRTVQNWRLSYWLGDYAQAVQAPGITKKLANGDEIPIPTDYVRPYAFPTEISKLKDKIESIYKVKFNSCLVGKFTSPKDKIGFHSDASDQMGTDPQIASLSLGAARTFSMKKKYALAKDQGVEEVSVNLQHGDLLIMKDGANANYLHAVPADPKCNQNNPRINLTFRNYTYHPDEQKIKSEPF
eukprot:TRINITY_DN17862_c0_g1_i1.p1 TRINITY_DN17862_c0_g1~~TRINITY_DN17862_c0_g1_i1.p1  ORF type:complete len:270 (+),score=47.90 TRINITY_DN17862_c0_g1_i1:51-860(+)